MICRRAPLRRSASGSLPYFQRPDDQFFPLIHRQGQRLEHEMVAVTIDDHAGQPIALAPDKPAKPRIDPAPRPIFHRLRDPALEKIEIEILFPARETARHDLRFGVVDRAPHEVVAPVLERNDIAVLRGRRRPSGLPR